MEESWHIINNEENLPVFTKRILNILKIRPKPLFFASSLFIFLTFVRPIFSVWAYSDEYDLFGESPILGNHMARDGNLISSVIYSQFSSKLGSNVDDLWRLRLISFLCLFLIVFHISNEILRQNQSRSVQFLLPIALTLPASMTFISWALLWQGSLAMIISYFAIVFWLKSQRHYQITAIILLSISILMSPVSAFSVISLHAAVLILTYSSNLKILKNTFRLLLLFAISGTLSILTLILWSYSNKIELNERVGLVKFNDIPEKVFWVISRPIVTSARFFDISSPSTINAFAFFLLTVTILFFGFKLQCSQSTKKACIRLILFFVMVCFSLTPIIITWSNQIEFRYIFGSSFALYLVTSCMVLYLIERYFKSTELWRFMLLVFMAILGASLMNINIDRQFISPYKAKNTFIQREISNCLNESELVSKVIVRQPLTRYPSRDNLGIFSQTTDLDSPWVPKPTIEAVLRSQNLPSVPVIIQNFNAKVEPNVCVVNLEKLSQSLFSNLDRS